MILFVVNERSGNGRGASVWQQVEGQLKARAIAYTAILADSATEAYDKTASMLQQTNLSGIAVVGGDGSLHSILPLIAGSGIPIGIIPAGSGNDTSLAFAVPRDPVAALEIILSGQTATADVIRTTAEGVSQYTLTAIAIGLDAAVAADVNNSGYKRWCNKLRLGSLAYLIGFFRGVSRFKTSGITVTLDGKPHRFERGWISAVTNIASYGGGLRICPDARYNDGHLHLCVVHGLSLGRLLYVFPTLLTGKHVNNRNVTMLRGRHAVINTSKPFLAYGDGEPLGETPIEAELLPGQLVFFTAASG